MSERPHQRPGPDRRVSLYATMLRVRLFEQRVRERCAGGQPPGPPLEAFATRAPTTS